MRNKPRVLVACLVVTVLATVVWALLRQREPSYRGKALSAWVTELGHSDFEAGGLAWDDWPLTKMRQNAEAAEAVRQIGSAGFPYLLSALTNADTDVPWKVQMARALPGPFRKLIRLGGSAGRRGGAALAFDALGVQAEPVTPELTQALYNYPSCKAAAFALSAVPRGWTVLTGAINSTNEWSALTAAWALAHRGATVPGTLNALESAATNQSASVAALACWALGRIGQDKEHVVPFLMTALGSTNNQVRFGALWGIGWLGTNALCAVPLLLEALHDPDQTIRDGAAASLKQIDHQTAAGAGVK